MFLSDASLWQRLQTDFQTGGLTALLPHAGSENHAPQLCWLSASQLACVWMAGSGEGRHDMHIVCSILKSSSRCWSPPRPLSGDPQRSEQNPLLFRSEQHVHLIHTAQSCRAESDAGSDDEPFSMQWTAQLRHRRRSTHSSRWQTPRDLLPTPAFCRHPPHQRADEFWLLPIYRCLPGVSGFGADHSQVLLLDPAGMATDTLVEIPDSTGRVQGSIVVSADGTTLLQFFRSRLADRIYRSIGSLDGLHWSPPAPITLPNNNSSIQALRLSSGLLAMVFNRCSLEAEPVPPSRWGEAQWPHTRWPLSVALSPDDGDSWPWIRDLDAGWGFAGEANWFCNSQLAYPSLLEGPARVLHIAYSWGHRSAIRYLRLHEQQILGCAH